VAELRNLESKLGEVLGLANKQVRQGSLTLPAQNAGKTNRLEHGWQTSVTSLHHDSRRSPEVRESDQLLLDLLLGRRPGHGQKGTAGAGTSENVARDVRPSPKADSGPCRARRAGVTSSSVTAKGHTTRSNPT
jgi:hypothetical protein